MVSLFGFILVLGIVVDDAIIIGESIHSQHESGHRGLGGAIEGVLQVYKPVLFAVVTTMIAFLPMLFLPGEEGRLILFLPIVVIAVLAFSLFESLLILPAHLSKINTSKPEVIPLLSNIQQFFSDSLKHIIEDYYRPFLELCLAWRYTALAIFVLAFVLCIGLLAFRWVNVTMVSKIESDMVIININMLQGSSMEEATAAVKQIEKAAMDLQNTLSNRYDNNSKIIYVDSAVESASHGRVSLFLDLDQKRAYSGHKLGQQVVEKAGDIARLRSTSFTTSIIREPSAIDLELAHMDAAILERAAQQLKKLLLSYEGVSWAYDNIRQGKREVVFDLKPEANDMGVTLAQVAAQVKEAFHGEYLTIYDEGNQRVAVSIQYPKEQRDSLWFFENMQIKLQDGSYVPLESLAELSYREAPSVIYLH